MVKLTRIYTKTGDQGETSLADGTRRHKNDLRVAAYGAVDEANSALGIARIHAEGRIQEIIERLQNDLFDLGAELATPEDEQTTEPSPHRLAISAKQVSRLEEEIDLLNKDLEPLSSFILPGGTPAAAYLHLARTILRRAERDMIAMELLNNEKIGENAKQFINRASDLAFVAARWANNQGTSDVLWQVGANH
jgi:cob(I)alamin adenosyltransferase